MKLLRFCLLPISLLALFTHSLVAQLPVTPVSAILKSPSKYAGKNLVVAGTVFSDRHHTMLLLDHPSAPQGIVLVISAAAKQSSDLDSFIEQIAHESGRAGAKGVIATFSGTVVVREGKVLFSATGVSLPSKR